MIFSCIEVYKRRDGNTMGQNRLNDLLGPEWKMNVIYLDIWLVLSHNLFVYQSASVSYILNQTKDLLLTLATGPSWLSSVLGK